jgi:putative flippase GtrA
VQFARFLVVGTANTAASYVIYLLLLLVVDYRGLHGRFCRRSRRGYLMHARFVFGARPGARSAASYLVTYAAMYLFRSS